MGDAQRRNTRRSHNRVRGEKLYEFVCDLLAASARGLEVNEPWSRGRLNELRAADEQAGRPKRQIWVCARAPRMGDKRLYSPVGAVYIPKRAADEPTHTVKARLRVE